MVSKLPGRMLWPLLLPGLLAAQPERLEKARSLDHSLRGAPLADRLQALKQEQLPLTEELEALIRGTGDPGLRDSRQGGEDFSQATVIESLPFGDSGTTAGASNDYSPGCGFSSAPDLVYRYTPDQDITIDVDLCGSGYDTILSVFANDNTTLVGCNDDACGGQSRLEFLELSAGDTYYFLVDGYGSASGAYQLAVVENLLPSPCEVFDSLATSVDALPFAFQGNTAGSPNIWGSSGTELGFRLQLDELTPLRIRTCLPGTTVDNRVYILDGHPCGTNTGELVLETGSSSCAWADGVDFTTVLPAGEYYLLAGGSFSSQTGDLALEIEFDSNWVNPCDASQPLACGDLLAANNSDAPDLYSGSAGDLLFNFVLEHRSQVRLSTCSPATAIDTRLYLFDVCPYDPSVSYLEYNDDSDCVSGSLKSTIETRLEAGEYWVIATGYSALEGAIELEFSCVANQCPVRLEPFEPEAVRHDQDWQFQLEGALLAAQFEDGDGDALVVEDLVLPVPGGFSGSLPFVIQVSDGDCTLADSLVLLVHDLPVPGLPAAVLDAAAGVVSLGFDYENPLEELAPLSHFSIRRNGRLLADTGQTAFVDTLADPGLYRYTVEAVYTQGTAASEPAPLLTWQELESPAELQAQLEQESGLVQLAWSQRLSSEQVYYDQSASSGAYNLPGTTLGTRISARGPCELIGLAFLTRDTGPTGSGGAFRAEIRGITNGQPDTTLWFQGESRSLDNQWIFVEAGPEPVLLDGEFIAGFVALDDRAHLAVDADLDHGRSWDLSPEGQWSPWNEAYLVRAWVRYPEGEVARLEPDRPETPRVRVPREPRLTLPALPVPPLEDGSAVRQFMDYGVYRNGEWLAGTPDTAFEDTLPQGGSYTYQVTARYGEGESLPTEGITVEWELVTVEGSLPVRFFLDPAWPNPFNPSTRVRFGLPRESAVRADLYALTGARVARLLDGPLGAGVHELTIDGSALASGVYLLHLSAGPEARTLRLTLMK
jgi:hypothetical protein